MRTRRAYNIAKVTFNRVRYGRNIFGINLFIYLGYLISLMCYALLLEDSAVFNATVIFDDFSCPIYLSEADQKNETLVGMLKTVSFYVCHNTPLSFSWLAFYLNVFQIWQDCFCDL